MELRAYLRCLLQGWAIAKVVIEVLSQIFWTGVCLRALADRRGHFYSGFLSESDHSECASARSQVLTTLVQNARLREVEPTMNPDVEWPRNHRSRASEIVVYRALIPIEVANLAVDHLRQTRFNVVAQPANEEA
jgi:hypothetical protein